MSDIEPLGIRGGGNGCVELGCDEGGNSVTDVGPIDLGSVGSHHRTDDDQSRTGGPRGERGEDGSEEDGDKEHKSCYHRGDTGFTTLGNTSCTFDESGDWTRTHEGTHGNSECINAVGDSAVFKVHCYGIAETSELGHRVQGTSRVWASRQDKHRM